MNHDYRFEFSRIDRQIKEMHANLLRIEAALQTREISETERKVSDHYGDNPVPIEEFEK